MSRFIDRLKRVSGDAPRPLGFGVARESTEKPRILLVASLTQNNIVTMVEGIVRADAVLLHISELNSFSKAIKETAKVLADVPLGLYLDETDGEEVKKVTEAGVDFMVFPMDASLSVLRKEGRVGRIIEVPASIEAGLLRSANDLSVDAVLVSGEPGKENSLTCQSLMRLQFYAGLLEKPLLAKVPLNTSTDELKTLWEAGIGGVIMEVVDKSDAERMPVLRSEIDTTTFPPRRKRRKMDVAIPHIGGGTEVSEEEEEEEEGDE